MSKALLKKDNRKDQKGETPLSLSPQLSSQIHRSFGVNPSQISFTESSEVKTKGARAIAQGNKVSFAPGEFSPGTKSGKMMIGHEVSHLVSQAKGQVPHFSGVHNDASMEAASDRAGNAFASGKTASQGSVSLSASNGSAAQMWGRSKKKSNEELLSGVTTNHEEHKKKTGHFKGYTPEQIDKYRTQGIRGVEGKDMGASYAPTLKGYQDEVWEMYENLGKQDYDFSADIRLGYYDLGKNNRKRQDKMDHSHEHSIGMGTLDLSPALVTLATKNLQIFASYLDEPEMQAYLRAFFLMTGGKDLEMDHNNTGAISVLVNSMFTRGISAMAGISQSAEGRQRQAEGQKGKDQMEVLIEADKILAKSETLRNLIKNYDTFSDERKQQIDAIRSDVPELIQVYEEIRNRILEIGLTAVPEDKVGLMSQDEQAQRAALLQAEQNPQAAQAPAAAQVPAAAQAPAAAPHNYKMDGFEHGTADSQGDSIAQLRSQLELIRRDPSKKDERKALSDRIAALMANPTPASAGSAAAPMDEDFSGASVDQRISTIQNRINALARSGDPDGQLSYYQSMLAGLQSEQANQSGSGSKSQSTPQKKLGWRQRFANHFSRKKK